MKMFWNVIETFYVHQQVNCILQQIIIELEKKTTIIEYRVQTEVMRICGPRICLICLVMGRLVEGSYTSIPFAYHHSFLQLGCG